MHLFLAFAPLFLCIHIEYLGKLELSRNSITTPENTLSFVNIIRRKNANFALALRKRLFCNAKPTLLPCKTAAFGMQNNRFCKALKARQLCNSYACEKYLHFYNLFSM
ncbi:hypothetical protein CTM61_09985 [Prevotella intermedia]|nr:hypothetical protein CTM61_09985 [Prevotella intermedia]